MSYQLQTTRYSQKKERLKTVKESNLHIGLVCQNDVDSGIDLAIALNRSGATVTLYLSQHHVARATGFFDRPAERLFDSGIIPRECQVKIRLVPRLRDPRSFLMTRNLANTIRKDTVDVVHILIGPGEIWLAVLAALLRKVPVASTLVIPRPNKGENFPDFVVYVAHWILARFSDVVIVNGSDQTQLVQKLYRVPRERIIHVPLCPRISAGKWHSGDLSGANGTILFFGEARKHKGLEYLIQAQPLISQSIPEAEFLIASRGPGLNRCRQLIEDTSRFEIHDGYFPATVMAEFFSRASVVVLPYTSASTSGVLLTAYSFNTPVIASKVGSLPEYVEEGITGFLVEPGNIEELAHATVMILKSPSLRRGMGMNAAKWIEKHAMAVIGETLSAYRRAIHIYSTPR